MVNGSCFDRHAHDTQGTVTATPCFCGTADQTTCSSASFATASVGSSYHGACYALEMTAGAVPGNLLTGITSSDPTTGFGQAGIANGLAQCLAAATGTDCYYNN